MDAETETEIFDHFRSLTEDKMVVLISHRFSTVRRADTIAVLNKGRVIEKGSHEEEKKSNVKAYMTNYFLHKKYELINIVCNEAIDILKSIQVKDQKGNLDKFFIFTQICCDFFNDTFSFFLNCFRESTC